MNYQLTQTGEQVQDILNQAPTTEETLQAEITRSTNKDDALELAIGNEKTRAEGVESNLQTAIGNEKTRAEGAEANLQTAIGNEKTRAELIEGGLRTDVDGIEAKIPTGASSENKLATESFVNSSVATNTADFKGTYNSLEALETAVQDANANDYAFVISTDAAGNTVYNRYKYVEGTGWVFEYALNNSSFTSSQWAAINSAITAALVAKLTGLPTATELTTQLNAIIDSVATEKSRAEGIESGLRTDVNANATAIGTEKTRAEGVEGNLSTAIGNEKTRAEGAELVLQQNINAEALLRGNADTALQTGIDGINEKIPAAASSSNQLADKAFVNSSIATNTAEFKGTYNSLAELQAVTGANANDYGFVISTDSAGNTVYNRYKYVEGTGWVFEYALNNSSFTAAQWASIQSGITAALVAKLNGLPDIDALNAMFAAITSKIPANASSSNKLVDYAQLVAALAGKQDTLIFDNVPTENSNNPVKSSGVYTAIATVTAAVMGLQSSKQDVLTFDQYPTAGSNNPVKSTGIYTAIENAVAPKADKTDLDNAVIRISTNEVDIAQLQAAYRGLTQNNVVPVAPTDPWPVANPQLNVIYRVTDRTNTPPQYYTDYMWNGTVMVEMAQYDNAIDSRPKKDSQNLVTSGGVFDNMGALDVSELNATENPHTLATYVDLSAALAAIPSDYQKGGMSIKFVQSSDNKYVQYRYIGTSTANADFINVANWQGVDAEPVAGSKNLVESGGVEGKLNQLGVNYSGSFVKDEAEKYYFPFLMVAGATYEITATFENALESNGYLSVVYEEDSSQIVGRKMSAGATQIVFPVYATITAKCLIRVYYNDTNNIILSIKSNIKTLPKIQIEANYNSYILNSGIIPIITGEYYWDKDTGVQTYFAGNHTYTDLIKCYNGDKFVYANGLGNYSIASVVFYNENMEFVSSEQHNTLGTSTEITSAINGYVRFGSSKEDLNVTLNSSKRKTLDRIENSISEIANELDERYIEQTIYDNSEVQLSDAENIICTLELTGGYYYYAHIILNHAVQTVSWLSFVDSNGTQLSGLSFPVGETENNVGYTPVSTINGKLRFYNSSADVTSANVTIKRIKIQHSFVANPLYGKKISLNGDSICAGKGDSGGFGSVIACMNNMIYQNVAVSGGTVAYSGDARHCISRTIQNMDADSDYIIIEGGVNDASLSPTPVPLGAITSGYNETLDDTTFYGAFESIMKQLTERFAGKKYGYVIVHQMTANYRHSNDKATSYYWAVVNCCQKWGVPFCDLNVAVPPFAFLPNDTFGDFKEKYTANGDGWHPTVEGYVKYYAPKIDAWMKTL